MHLYVMHKREILVVLAAFLASFILLLFIGLAGPNVSKLDTTSASEIFRSDRINATAMESLLQRGPFALYTPAMSAYSQHVTLFLRLELRDVQPTESFSSEFVIALRIVGIVNDDKKIEILNEDIEKSEGRVHQLFCAGRRCHAVRVFRLDFLEFKNYDFEITFKNLEPVHVKYQISDIRFSFQSTNTSFTSLTVWFRFVFLLTAFAVTCCFTHSLLRFPFVDWSTEQKWTAILLPLLVLFNNPFYPTVFLFSSALPRVLDVIFKTSFCTTVLLFGLVFFHGIRQTSRTFSRFYLPKLLICGSFFFSVTYVASWSRTACLQKPTLDEELAFESSLLMRSCVYLFYSSLFALLIYFLALVLTACTELRTMPFFDLRIKLQSFLMAVTLTISILITVLNLPSNDSLDGEQEDVTRIRMLQLLPWTYESTSSASFLSFYSITNLFVFFCAYFYSPSKSALMDSRVLRDDPTISMMNDSDEDIIYASDIEPLSQIRLIEHADDDEESD